jgi:hypothetical protein
MLRVVDWLGWVRRELGGGVSFVSPAGAQLFEEAGAWAGRCWSTR